MYDTYVIKIYVFQNIIALNVEQSVYLDQIKEII